MNTLYIFGAKYLFIFSLLIAGGWFFTLPREIKKRVGLMGISAAILSFIVARVASLFYYDPRPFVEGHFSPLISHAADNGFPSDHMLLVAVVASLVTLYTPKLSIWLWIVALLVGASRILVGVHHVVDIIGSTFIAIISLGVVYFVHKKRSNVIL